MYFLGILFAILSGLVNYFGQVLQKKAINDIKLKKGEAKMIDMIKNPLWILGLILAIVIAGIIFASLAQFYIGPALLPGLSSAGMIVLAIGSVVLLKEKLKKRSISLSRC
jgi:hypothetical protein